MANSIVLGTELMLFQGDGQKALAYATSCKLTISQSVLTTSSKDSGKWESKSKGKLNWSATSDNLFCVATYKELVDAMIARTEVQLQFSTVSNPNGETDTDASTWTPSTDGYSGKALITSIDANASDGENATYSITFEGTGALTAVEA